MTDLEKRKLQEVAEDYAQRGYRLVLEPRPDQLPAFLRPFSVNLIASNDSEHIALIVRKAPELQSPEVTQLADAVAAQPGWRLELLVVNPPAAEEVPVYGDLVPDAQVETLLENAAALNHARQTEAAAMLVWSAAEAILRKLARARTTDAERRGSSYVLKKLYADGILDPSSYAILERVLQFRNAFAHGFAARVRPETIDELIAEVSRLRTLQAA
jgi:uncharacterized protein YutE (UPF0331/DUF86 family)